jgi:hypothetical protein
VEQRAAVIDKIYWLIQVRFAAAPSRTEGAMKNKYLVSLVLLAIGLGVAYVVTAASWAGAAVN